MWSLHLRRGSETLALLVSLAKSPQFIWLRFDWSVRLSFAAGSFPNSSEQVQSTLQLVRHFCSFLAVAFIDAYGHVWEFVALASEESPIRLESLRYRTTIHCRGQFLSCPET